MIHEQRYWGTDDSQQPPCHPQNVLFFIHSFTDTHSHTRYPLSFTEFIPRSAALGLLLSIHMLIHNSGNTVPLFFPFPMIAGFTALLLRSHGLLLDFQSIHPVTDRWSRLSPICRDVLELGDTWTDVQWPSSCSGFDLEGISLTTLSISRDYEDKNLTKPYLTITIWYIAILQAQRYIEMFVLFFI